MLQGKFRRLIRVAVADRPKKLDVFRDVPSDGRDLVQDQAPDPRGKVVQSDQGVFKVRVSGCAIDDPMDIQVLPHQVRSVARAGLIEALDFIRQGEQLLPRAGVGTKCRLAGG